jgi:acyl carrier protein
VDIAHHDPQDHDATATRIRAIVATVLGIPVDEVGVDEDFADLMVDSLQRLEIIVQVERSFGVRFASAEAEKIESVDGVLALMEAKDVAG